MLTSGSNQLHSYLKLVVELTYSCPALQAVHLAQAPHISSAHAMQN